MTAVALGRRCFPVPSLDAAVPLAAKLTNPLLVGELGGNMPYGFDLNNSPADLEARTDIHRPMNAGARLFPLDQSRCDLDPLALASFTVLS